MHSTKSVFSRFHSQSSFIVELFGRSFYQLMLLAVVLLAQNEVAVAAPAGKVGELKADGLTVAVVSDNTSGERFNIEISNKGAAIEAPEIFTLDNPPRLVIDLPKIEVRGSKKSDVKNDKITGIRIGVHPGKARIVIDLAGASVPGFVVSEGNGSKLLGVKLDFASAGAPMEPVSPGTAASGKTIELSDLPKPDAEEPQKEVITAKAEVPKPTPKNTPITAPKNPVIKVDERVIDQASVEKHAVEAIGPSDEEKELDKSLSELASKSGNLKPAPEDLDEDFKDIDPGTLAAEKSAPAKSQPKVEDQERVLPGHITGEDDGGKKAHPVEAAKGAKAEGTKTETGKKDAVIAGEKGESEAETELSDEDALKMLELADEAVKKPAAGEGAAVTPPTAAKGAGSAKTEKTLADLAAEPSKHGEAEAAAAAKTHAAAGAAAEAVEEEGSPEELAKLIGEPEKIGASKGEAEKGGPAQGAASQAGPPPAGAAVVKGIFYRAADEGKTSAVVIEVGNLNNYSLSQKKKNLYELTVDQAALAGEHVAYPQFPPDTFQGFEAVLAEQSGATVLVKIYVAEGTKLSPFRVKDQLWVKVLK